MLRFVDKVVDEFVSRIMPATARAIFMHVECRLHGLYYRPVSLTIKYLPERLSLYIPVAVSIVAE